jgi:hypothetical protein
MEGYFAIKYKEWKKELREHWKLILIFLVLVLISVAIDYASGFYVTHKAEVKTVPDLILSHFGPYNLNFIYGYGALVLTALLFIYPFFFKVKKFHIALFQLSLLTILRAVFITLTHLQTPFDAIPVLAPKIFSFLVFHNDQFFSGHVALPFLGFLLFSESKIKWLFLLGSFIMGVTVLAMHQHYSIDVFAAFFITYGSYKIGRWTLHKLKLIKIE